MPFFQTNFFGESYLGLFGFSTDQYCLISSRLSENKLARIEETLGVKTIPTTVFSFSLAGIMSAGNDNGVLLPYLSEDEEIERVRKSVDNVCVVQDTFTALGNLVVANNKGAVISNVFSEETRKSIEGCLGVKTVRRTIAGCSEVGALCLATNKGFVVTPNTSDKEVKELEGIFKVKGGRASANFGSKAVGCCIVANSNGMLIGGETTPIEVDYINEALGFF
ncbi:MAG: translation initiation factor IF-6 [Candidatus Altiarchaeota archaeon]|nr:translation initiation factor IF-6 [Candidatus Altiarchaeota archaeon]